MNQVQKLFLHHSGVLRGFIQALLVDHETVDDVLHAVFLCVTDKADQFQIGTDFLAWAKTIARIEVLRASQDRRRAPRSLSTETIELLAAEAPLEEPDPERVRALAVCLDQLALRSRLAIDLRYVQGLKPGAVAVQMGLAETSVYVLLSKARRALRQCLERRLPEEGRHER